MLCCRTQSVFVFYKVAPNHDMYSKLKILPRNLNIPARDISKSNFLIDSASADNFQF